MARDLNKNNRLSEAVNILSNTDNISSFVRIGGVTGGTSTNSLKLNPQALAVSIWQSVVETDTKATASDGTIFSTVETETEKYPVTIIYSNGIDQITVSELTDTIFIWSNTRDITVNRSDNSGFNPVVFAGAIAGFLGTPVRSLNTYQNTRTFRIIYKGQNIDLKSSATDISISSLSRLLANYTSTQNDSRVSAALVPTVTETLAGTTSEVFADDLNARLTNAEADIDSAEASIALKAPLASPALIGTPTAPTATAGTNTTQIATTAFVTGAITTLVDGAPGVLDTLNEIAASLGDDPDFAGTLSGEIASKANIQDPTFSGTVTTDSITIDNNKISTTVTNANLELDPSGTGNVTVQSNLVVTGVTFTNSIASTVSGVNIQGDTTFTAGIPNFQAVSQTVVSLTGATGVVVHDLSLGAVFFHSSISANFTANFTNVPTTDDRGIGVALILNQGGTGHIPTAVQINGASATLRWAYNTIPTPSSNQIDTVSFTLIRTGATWYVIGQHTNFA